MAPRSKVDLVSRCDGEDSDVEEVCYKVPPSSRGLLRSIVGDEPKDYEDASPRYDFSTGVRPRFEDTQARRCCGRGVAVSSALVSTSLLTAGAAACGLLSPTMWEASGHEAKQEVAMMRPEDVWEMSGDACLAYEDNVDIPGFEIAARDNSYSANDCCSSCNQLVDCTAWVWVQQSDFISYKCYLKGGAPSEALQTRQRSGFVAGKRHQHSQQQQLQQQLQQQQLQQQQAAWQQQALLAGSAPSPYYVVQAPAPAPKSMLQAAVDRLLCVLHLRGPDPVPSPNPPAPSPWAGWETGYTGVQNTGYASQATEWQYPTHAPTTTTEAVTECGFMEDDWYYPGNNFQEFTGVRSPERCCDRCNKNKGCYAWSFDHALRRCQLKGDMPRERLTKVRKEGTVSGLATQAGRSIDVIEQERGQSLYCFALMIPDSYEEDLLRMQYENGWGLFYCDEYDVYSDKVVKVAQGIRTIKVDTSLKCDFGGEFGTALNTGIFINVWKKVANVGHFKLHDWTVKVDPDAPFSPQRLRAVVARFSDAGGGPVYLNNCPRGLHGPLEVFSTAAVEAWVSGHQQCVDYFNGQCGGKPYCEWGEDMFIDQCLDQVLHLRREFASTLLVEDHCDPPPDWKSCAAPEIVSFHPFKTEDEYRACIQNMGM